MPARISCAPPLPFDVGLLCQLAREGSDVRVSLAALPAPVFERALEAARDHNVLGLILPAALSLAPGPPAPLAERLTDAEAAGAGRALLYETELLAVLRSLEAAGVEAPVLKGGFLAACVYEDFAARSMGDLDLFVRREDFPRATAGLRKAGYTCGDPGQETGGESRFRSPAGVSVELHYDLTQGTRFRGVVDFPEMELWSRRRVFHTARGTICSLEPTDHLLYLAYHAGILHLFTALIWLVDVDRFIRRFREDIAWADVPGRARRIGCATSVWHCLTLALELLGTPLDEAVLEALRPPASRAILVQRGLGPRRALRGLTPPSQLRMALGQMLLLDTGGAVLRSLWQGLFPPRQWLAWRYRTSSPMALFALRALYPLGGWLRRPP